MKRTVAGRDRTTLRQLVRAVYHADAHDDGNVRRLARELIRSVQHLAFAELQRRTSRFVGSLNEAGHRREERKQHGASRNVRVGDFDLATLNSVQRLRSVGRELRLCVAHNNCEGREYRHALVDRSGEFWRIEKDGEAVGLVQVEAATRRIMCISGRNNDPLRLRRSTALGFLRGIDAIGDDIETFARVGAFDVFRHGTPKADVEAHCFDREYSVWCFPEQPMIVVRRRNRSKAEPTRRGRRRPPGQRQRRPRALPRADVWTRFEPEEDFVDIDDEPVRRPERDALTDWSWNCWYSGAVSLGELFDLCLRCPEVHAAIRCAFALESIASSSA